MVQREINPPMNENTKIWRFFDFPKFMSMLTSGELFFSNIKSLEDPYEGVLPKAVKDKYKQRFWGKINERKRSSRNNFRKDRRNKL